MSGTINPFFTSPQLGAGLSNLASAFMPNPQRDLARARTEQIRGEIEGARALSDAYATGLGADPAAGWRAIFSAGARTGNPQHIRALSEAAGVYGATQGIPESDLGRIVVGAGGRWTNTEGGTRYVTGVESADRRRGQDVAAGAQRYAVDQQQAGLDRRMAPEINPGNVVVVPPNSPLAGRADANGRIAGDQRPQTFEQARAAEVGPFVRGEGTPEEQDRRRAVVAPTVSAAEARAGAPGRTPAVNQSTLTAIGQQIDAQSTDQGGTFVLTPEARGWIGRRATQLYQHGEEGTRLNPAEAVAQAMAEFMQAGPPRADSSWNPLSDRTMGLPQSLRSGTAGGSGAAQQVQQQSQRPAAPREGATATNPTTGERLIYRNGRWEPVA